MAIWREVKRRTKLGIPPLLLLAIAGYFGWSATQGDHGLQAFARQQTQLRLANQELAAANTQVDVWERRVAELQSNHLDGDMLDEQARSVLNLAMPNEVVMLYERGKPLF